MYSGTTTTTTTTTAATSTSNNNNININDNNIVRVLGGRGPGTGAAGGLGRDVLPGALRRGLIWRTVYISSNDINSITTSNMMLLFVLLVLLLLLLLLLLDGKGAATAANLRTRTLDFRGFDSGRILILRGGIPRPVGNFPERLSQAILVGMILVGRLGAVLLCITM